MQQQTNDGAQASALRNALVVEEFKSLKTEIAYLIQDTRSLELYAVGALLAYYAWLTTHCLPENPFAWGLGFAIPILGVWRSWANVKRMLEIADYVKGQEQEHKLGPELGWEHFLEIRRRALLSKIKSGSHVVFWLVLLAIAVSAFRFSDTLTKAACHPASNTAPAGKTSG